MTSNQIKCVSSLIIKWHFSSVAAWNIPTIFIAIENDLSLNRKQNETKKCFPLGSVEIRHNVLLLRFFKLFINTAIQNVTNLIMQQQKSLFYFWPHWITSNVNIHLNRRLATNAITISNMWFPFSCNKYI